MGSYLQSFIALMFKKSGDFLLSNVVKVILTPISRFISVILLLVSVQMTYAQNAIDPVINNIKYKIELDRYDSSKGTASVVGFEEGEISSIQFPDSIEYIYYPPFWDTPLKGKAVVSRIWPKAFINCTGLQTVTLPRTLNYIENNAFQGCKNLTNINTNNVMHIGNYAFEGCSNLKSLNLDKIENLSSGMFASCSSLSEIYLPNARQNAIGITVGCFKHCTQLKKVYIPKLPRIFDHMFEGCESLEEVIAPNVTIIEKGAFLRCLNLGSLKFPKVEKIDKIAFQESGIKSIQLVKATMIMESAFENAEKLTSINAPYVKNIKGYAFAGCTSLNEIEFPEVMELGNNVFENCSALSNISFPRIYAIGNYAFKNCKNLETVYLNSKMKNPKIGQNAFNGCNRLRNLWMNNFYNACDNTFDIHHYSDVLLFVPKQLRELYREDSIWSKFIVVDEFNIHLYKSRNITYLDEIKTDNGQKKISGVVADGMTQLYFIVKDANGNKWTEDINQWQVKLLFNGTEAPEAITGKILGATNQLPGDQKGFIYAVPESYPDDISTPMYNIEIRLEKKGLYNHVIDVLIKNLTIMRPPALLIPDMNNASTLSTLKKMLVSKNLYRSSDIIEWINPSVYDNRVDRYVEGMKKANVSDKLQKRYFDKGIVAPSCVIIGEGVGSLIGYLYAAQAPQYSIHSLIGISPTFGSPLIDKLPFYFRTPLWLKDYYQFESNSEIVQQALSSKIPSNINVRFFGGAIKNPDNILDWKDTEYGDYSSTHLSNLRWIWEEVADEVLPRGKGSFAELSNNVFGRYANDGFFNYLGINDKQSENIILDSSQCVGWCGVKSETHHYKLPHNKRVLSSVAGCLQDFTGNHSLSRKNSGAANQLLIPSNNSIESVGSRNIEESNMIQDAEKLDISAEFVPASNGIYVKLNKQDEVENTSVFAYMGNMLLSVSHTESGLIKVPGYYDGEIEIMACGNYGSSVIVASSKINVTTSAELIAIMSVDDSDVIGIGSEINPVFKGYWSDGSISYVTPELTAEYDCVAISGSKITGRNEGNTLITASIGDINTVFNIRVVDNVEPIDINTTTITLSKKEIIGFPGEKIELNAEVESDEDIDKSVLWSSADEKIATVNSDGLVELISPGETVVTANCNGATAECRIIVKEVPMTGIELDKTEAEGYIGGTVQLTATVKPEDTTDDTTVTWKSSDEEVATVDENGLVSCLAEGEAVITATCGEFSAECTVTVTDRPPFVAIASLELSESEIELALNFTYSLFAIIAPENATDTELEWSSSDINVARVYEGVVYGIVPGEAVITAKTTDGSNISASCKVTIVETSGIDGIEGDGVKVTAAAGVITVKGAAAGSTVEVYSMSGACVAAKTIESSVEEFPVAASGIYVVRAGGKTFKVAL